jgi:DUF2924 family protein
MKKTNELAGLLASRRLKVGTVIYHSTRTHHDRNVQATIEADGIRLGGQLYPSLSTAAFAVCGYRTNGWTFWRVRPRGDAIATLREAG